MCRYGGLYYSKHSSIKCRRSGKRVELSGHLNECRIARSIARILLPQSEVYPSNILYPSFSTSPPLTPLLLKEPVMKISLKTRKFCGNFEIPLAVLDRPIYHVFIQYACIIKNDKHCTGKASAMDSTHIYADGFNIFPSYKDKFGQMNF